MNTNPLEGMLQQLDLLPFLMLLETLLAREGFGDIEILDRRESRQKTRLGGFEIRCRAKIGNQAGLVLVKVLPKHAI